MANEKYISKINVNGDTYEVKDSKANEVEITTTDTTPTDENVEMWVNLGQKHTVYIPETATDVSYNNSKTLLDANNLQDAIDSIAEVIHPTLTVYAENGTELTISRGDITIEGTVESNSFTTNIPQKGVWNIEATYDGETKATTVNVQTVKNYKVYMLQASICGVEWGFTGNSLTRTDDSALFTDPVPYVNNGETPGSSPFDNLYPWSEMTIVTHNGNSLVKIPKFWYKMEKTASSLSIKIASKPAEGFKVSPAHRDRGEGEKNYVYIGRYHSDSTYKSTSGVKPISSITRATARANTHALGEEYWQLDMSLWITIWLLYLVEFANWNSQLTIGYGCGGGSSVGKENSGSTDSMPYHTGTMQTSRTTYGVGIQYRYIEDPWANVLDWVDGITFNGANIYAYESPDQYSDNYASEGAVLVGTRPTSSNYIQNWNISSTKGFDWFMYPSSVGGSTNQVPDCCYYGAGGVVLLVGGHYYYQNAGRGLFCLGGGYAASGSYGDVGVRLQRIPKSN